MISWQIVRDLYPGWVVDRTERVRRFLALCGIVAEDFQLLIIAEHLLTREIAAAVPRGQGKTTIFSGMGMAVMHDEPGALVLAAAATRDQARILFETAVSFTRRPALNKAFSSTINEVRHTNGSLLRTLASDQGGKSHGRTPRLALVDDLHGHPDNRTYVAQKTAQTKNPEMHIVVISTMGAVRKGPWWHLDQAALQLPVLVYENDWFQLRRSASGGFGSLRWALPADIDPATVTGRDLKRVNPASWITEESLQEQLESPALPRHMALAYHGNLWPSAAVSWLPSGAWAECLDVTAKIPAGAEVVVGVDRGTQTDATGIVLLHTRADGRVVEHHLLLPSPSLQDDLLNALRKLAGEYKILAIGYDAWQMQDIADILSREGLLMVKHSMATAPRARSSQELYELIIGKVLAHDGAADLTLHLSNTVGRQVREGFVIDKGIDNAAIDLFIALMVANHIRLELLAQPRESVYARKDMLIL